MAMPTVHPNRMRTVHVLLPAHIHQVLREESRGQGVSANEVVRQALEAWLHERRRVRLAEEIQRYAQAEAGGPDDLDPALESAGLAVLSEGGA
jgi:Arc/MetJ-type ribon-helix-helix transcriptional regulator